MFDLVIVHQKLVSDSALLRGNHVVFLVVRPDASLFRVAVEYGALGYLSENTSPELLRATLELHPGDLLIEPAFIHWALKVTTTNNEPSTNVDALTNREQDIFTLRQQGLPLHEIAERLDIAEGTVKRHLANIAVKRKQRRMLE